MHNYSISKLLGLEGVRVKNISHTDTSIKLYVTTAKEQSHALGVEITRLRFMITGIRHLKIYRLAESML